jgi:hypothetical protein
MRTLLVPVVFVLAFTTAQAAEKGIYVGGNYSYSRASDDSASRFSDAAAENFSGYAPYAGYKFNKNIAMELGYSGLIEQAGNKSFGSTSYSDDGRYWGVYGDVVGMYPMADDISLLGSVGYARVNLASTSLSAENDSNAYRFGFGAQWDISNKIGVRAIVRYVGTDFASINNYVQGTVGLNYQFQ